MDISARNLSINNQGSVRQHVVGVNSKANSGKHVIKTNKNKDDDIGMLIGRGKSATVDISKEGRKLLRDLQKEKYDEVQKSIEETAEGYQKANNLYSRLQREEDYELTDEDKAFVNDSLLELTAKKYVYDKTHIITKEEYQGLLSELKEEFNARIQMYADMQDKLEADFLGDETSKRAQMIANAKLDETQKKRIIEILDEVLKEDDEEESEETEEVKSAEDSGENSENTEPGVLQFDETGKSMDEQLLDRAFDLIDRNKETLDNLASKTVADSKETREFSDKMDAEFLRVADLLNNEELTEEQKLEEFVNSAEYMKDLNHEKMLSEVRNRFDFSTWLVGKIEFNNHNNLREVLNTGGSKNGMGGLDMVLDFLINDNGDLRK